MKERERVRIRKELGKPKPWTGDPILRKYRFCNVRREDDTVTRWIASHWRNPHKDDPDLWFAMCVARLINWPDSLMDLKYPVPWDSKDFIATLQLRKIHGLKVFSSAYIVSTNGKPMDKVEYLAKYVLDPMWDDRNHIRPVKRERLADLHKILMVYNGMGSFMAAQIVADVKYVNPLLEAPDWYWWAASGPGSRRGMNRVIGRPVNMSWHEPTWLEELHTLQYEVDKLWNEPLHAQDLQNCLCEFDKYQRVKLGEGRPRQNYPGI